ncbi:MAG: RT0821/Lpp0805 family surface protein [Candidatus Midichloria sp.]|nr:MAG: RT0821/Lpp0805 family surface protein [Candidatus Midichloria sp.]
MYKFSLETISIPLILSLAVVACVPSINQAGKINKTHADTVNGAIVGGLLGSHIGGGTGNVAATTTGALAGGIMGHSIGDQLDHADIEAINRTQQKALEYAKTGQQVSWKNPDTGASGYVVPTKTYVMHGQNCREYTQTVKIGGKTQEAFGHACRREDGAWEIIQ